MKNYFSSFFLVAFFVLPLLGWRLVAHASIPSEYQSAIDEKNKRIEEVRQKIIETQNQLVQTENQKQSLSSDLNKISKTVSNLALNIQSGEITLEKIQLEIGAINTDISEKQKIIEQKREILQILMRSLASENFASMFLAFFAAKSFSDTLLESTSYARLNDRVLEEISSIEKLKYSLENAIYRASEKRSEVSKTTVALKSKKIILEDQRQLRNEILTETKAKEKLYLMQIASLESEQEKLEDEVDAIESELREKFDISLIPGTRTISFTWPIILQAQGGIGRQSQSYGIKSRLYRGKPHNGLDIAAPIGTEVHASEDGIVVGADDNDQSKRKKYQYGKYVMIEHSNKFMTLYAHLSNYTVKKGDRVKRGQIIGYSGNTGYSTGAHLHLGLYLASTVSFRALPPARGLVPIGVTLNPADYLK